MNYKTFESVHVDKVLDAPYRTMFSTNKAAKYAFYKIDDILKSVFPKNWYGTGKYGPGMLSGIYDYGGEVGRSGLNYINSSYTCFRILVEDVNKVIVRQGIKPIEVIGKNPEEQVNETRRLVDIIREYATRIFNPASSTYKKLIEITSETRRRGNSVEVNTVEILRSRFGSDNVEVIAGEGKVIDAMDGVDCKIKIGGGVKTVQIKPFDRYYLNKEIGKTIVYGCPIVKKYTTDYMAFYKNGHVVIFDNKNTIIDGGNFIFPSNALIYDIRK